MAQYFPNTPGMCIKFEYNGDSDVFIVPVNEDFVISSSQEYTKPIQSLFTVIKNAVTSGAFLGGGLSAFTKLGMDLQDLMGFRLLGKDYYTKGWAGAKDSELPPIKLEFRWGWMGKWNSKLECRDPAYLLMGKTLPTGDSFSIVSPMPAPVDVYTAYTKGALKSFWEAGVSVATTVTTTIANAISGTSSTESVWSSYSLNNNTGVTTKTWTMVLGYWKGGSSITTDFVPMMDLGNNIVTGSSLSTSPQVQKVGNKFYPINSSVTLTLSPVSLYTSGMFKTSKYDSTTTSGV